MVLLPLPVVHTVCSSLSVADFIQALVAHSSGFNYEQDGGRIEDHRSQDGQCERPAHVIVLPMRHPVTAIAPGSEDNDREEATGGGQEEQGALGEQQHDVQVVVFGHDQEGCHQEASDEAQREADSEEELHRDEERGQQEVMNHRVLVVKNPATAVEGLVVEVVGLYKVIEAHLPET